MEKYNVLILDDIEFVGKNLCKRFYETSRFYSKNLGIEIKPHFEVVQIGDCYKNTLEKIKDSIIERKIDYLILDRGFNNIENIKADAFSVNMDNKINVEELLKDIPTEYYKRIKGVIVYTYIPDEKEKDFDIEKFRDDIYTILSEKISIENIQIILCNKEIYKDTGLKLYDYDYDKINEKFSNVTGSKSKFGLYGLFMGEILYHRLIQMINKQKKFMITKGKSSKVLSFIILFLVFTGLSIGGNALYNIFSIYINNVFLLFCSVVFAIVLPIIILLKNPDWINLKAFLDSENK